MINIGKDQLLDEGLYAEIKTQILFNEITLEQLSYNSLCVSICRELRHIHVLIYNTIDTYSELQWAFVLISEKDNSEIAYLLEMVANLKTSLQIKADALKYVSSRKKTMFKY